MIATDLGWVEERNPTQKTEILLGFTSFKRHFAQVGKPAHRKWLPNLRIYVHLSCSFRRLVSDYRFLKEVGNFVVCKVSIGRRKLRDLCRTPIWQEFQDCSVKRDRALEFS
jgi:hypothetical protein